jgi:hypothetical protein
MTIIILAALAWWLIRGDIPAFCDKVARIAGRVYALGFVSGQYVHLANQWLADRVTGRQPWPQPFIKRQPSPRSAEALLGAENFILLDEAALEVECLTFEAPAAKPAKRRRARATKAVAGG